VQIGGREPDSAEEEVLLMTEVDSLQSQLRKKGETFNEKIETVFMEGLIGKSTSARIRRWTIRRDQLRKMAEAPHATSGGPAASLDDTGTSLKADQHVEKAEEKQTKGFHHLFLIILLVSASFGYGRRAVHLHMSIGRVVLDPRQIVCVPSQLVFNGAPICVEPLIEIMKVYGMTVF
jgi:hypothetical protein